MEVGAGADFLFMTMEHSGWSEGTIKMLIATSRVADLPTIVRVRCLLFKQALADGIGALRT